MKWLVPKRQRTKRRLRTGTTEKSDTRWDSAKFDESTGQMYLETTAGLRISDDATWARDSQLLRAEDPGEDYDYNAYMKRFEAGKRDLSKSKREKELDALKKSKGRGSKGAPSLQDSAIECILQNISDITLEGIECLPLPIVKRLWLAADRRCSKSFNTWSIFSKILRQDDDSSLKLLRYHQNIKSPNRQLEIFTNPLTSKSYEFITSLSITIVVPNPDLIKLSRVKNLGVLEIIDVQGTEYMAVGDRLIRSWHDAALSDGAFSVLRILKLWNHDRLTIKSLAYLNAFPALAVYDVHGCSFDLNAKVEATRLGWKPTLETNILGMLETTCAKRAAILRTNLGMEARPLQAFSSEHLWQGAKVQRIPRTEIPKFLAQIEANEVDNLERPKKSKSKRMHFPADSRPKAPTEAWDVPSYRTYARIGELRNDTDLVRAGVAAADQAVVGNELVNSVPIVSLRLGDFPSSLQPASDGDRSDYSASCFDYSWDEKPRLAASTKRGLAFIRIKILPATSPAGKDGSSEPIKAGTLKIPPSTQAAPIKRQAAGIVRNKKRKLNDVLGSFL